MGAHLPPSPFTFLPTPLTLLPSLLFLFSLLLAPALAFGQRADRPNIVFILADDAGYGDLSVYGQKQFKTPFLDRMAGEGARFTQFYTGAPVCAPARSALMTGQHTGHTYIRGNKEVEPEGQEPLPAAVYTLPEMLQKAGYVTGAFGKWGLGSPGSEGDPLRQGFDHFFGYNCQRLAHNYYPDHLWDDAQKVMLPGNTGSALATYAPDVIQEKALAFIEENRNRPFFLYIPIVIPHAELILPEDSVFQRFHRKFDEPKPFEGVDYGKPNFRLGGYGSQKAPRAAYAAMMTRLDRYVGEVLQKLKDLGLDDNTIVMFTSDNGPHLEGGADPDFFRSAGPWRGYKRDVYEGGIRMPMIVRWPGKIRPGTVVDHIAAGWDVMPTLAALAGAPAPTGIDGISFLPTLLGQKGQKVHDYLYWEFHEQGGRQAIRQGRWKAVRYNVGRDPEAPVQLYDLDADPGELHDVSAQRPDLVRQMLQLMKESRTPSALFNFGQTAFKG